MVQASAPMSPAAGAFGDVNTSPLCGRGSAGMGTGETEATAGKPAPSRSEEGSDPAAAGVAGPAGGGAAPGEKTPAIEVPTLELALLPAFGGRGGKSPNARRCDVAPEGAFSGDSRGDAPLDRGLGEPLAQSLGRGGDGEVCRLEPGAVDASGFPLSSRADAGAWAIASQSAAIHSSASALEAQSNSMDFESASRTTRPCCGLPRLARPPKLGILGILDAGPFDAERAPRSLSKEPFELERWTGGGGADADPASSSLSLSPAPQALSTPLSTPLSSPFSAGGPRASTDVISRNATWLETVLVDSEDE